MPDAVFEIVNLSHRFGRRVILDGVSLSAHAGEVVGLLGPNGAGKTTVFRCASGLLRPLGGSVRLKGEALDGLPLHLRARKGLGYLPQGGSVFQNLSTRENLLAVLEANRKPDPKPKADALLARFSLDAVASNRACTLSGGERRRLEVARAVCLEPAVLLTDEPFTGVDPIAASEISGILRSLARDGASIVITDHNIHETLALCDRAYLLFEGKVLFHGTPEDLSSNPKVRKHYLGEGFRIPPKPVR